MDRTVGVIGLGLMGGTLASHLLERGPVVGYDPVAARTSEHEGRGGTVATSAADVARACEIAILSLPNGEVMRSVCREIADATKGPLLVIDTTTADPDESIEAATLLAGSGVGFVDATISGNAAQAEAKDIIFMVGGEADDVRTATEVLGPLGRAVHPVGGVGTGSRMKLVVNHVLSINRAAVAEGLAVAEKAGIDLDTAIEILRDSAAYSKAMDIWGDRMVSGDHWPPASRVRQSHKDARLINEHAARLGASSELAQVVRAALVEAEDGGLADADNSSVMEVMRRRARIGRYTETEAAERGDSAPEGQSG